MWELELKKLKVQQCGSSGTECNVQIDETRINFETFITTYFDLFFLLKKKKEKKKKKKRQKGYIFENFGA